MKYKVTIETTKEGVVLDTEEMVVESSRKPKVGEGYSLLCHPPIEKTVINVV